MVSVCLADGSKADAAVLMLVTAVSNGRVVKTASSGKKARRGAIKAKAVEHSFVIEEESADGDSGDGLGAVDFEMGMANMFD
jgi:hypothetical protein